MSFQTIQEVGADQLREGFRASIQAQQVSVAASFKGSKNLTSSTVFFQDGVHFDLTYQPMKGLAQKAFTAAWSELLSKYANAHHVSAVIAAPNHISVELVHQWIEGLNEASTREQCMLHAIDIQPASAAVSVALTLTGAVYESKQPSNGSGATTSGATNSGATTSGATNSGATTSGPKKGDLLCVTGELGAAFAGLRVLLREKTIWQEATNAKLELEQTLQPDLEPYQVVVAKQLAPMPNVVYAETLKTVLSAHPSLRFDHALLKNGLHNELQTLASRWDCGFEFYESALPISLETRQVADELEEDVTRYALLGGEDYEYVFTIPESETEVLSSFEGMYNVIGRITSQEDGILMHSANEESTS
jgi:thiamine-monophosphate kinase